MQNLIAVKIYLKDRHCEPVVTIYCDKVAETENGHWLWVSKDGSVIRGYPTQNIIEVRFLYEDV